MRPYAKFVAPLVVFLAVSATAVHAAPMTDLFTFTSTQTDTVTASILASPTPSSFVLGTSFTLSGITAMVGAVPLTGDVTFFSAGGAEGGGSSFIGPLLFSGPVSMPTFLLDTFSLSGTADLGDGPQLVTGNLTISQSTPSTQSPVPEPFTLGLTGTGILGLVEMLRRRHSLLRP